MSSSEMVWWLDQIHLACQKLDGVRKAASKDNRGSDDIELRVLGSEDPAEIIAYGSLVYRKKRWPAGEAKLLDLAAKQQDPMLLVAYARLVIRQIWPEAEPLINQDKKAAREYNRFYMRYQRRLISSFIKPKTDKTKRDSNNPPKSFPEVPISFIPNNSIFSKEALVALVVIECIIVIVLILSLMACLHV